MDNTIDATIDYHQRYRIGKDGVNIGTISICNDESFVVSIMDKWTQTYDLFKTRGLSLLMERYVTYKEYLSWHHGKKQELLDTIDSSGRLQSIFRPDFEGYFELMKNINPELYQFFFRPLSAKIDQKSRELHTYIVGSSGSGKSEFMKRLIHEQLQEDSAVILIDPKGDLAEQVARFKEFAPNGKHHDRLVFFHANLFEKDGLFPVFNPFDQSDNVNIASSELRNTLNTIFTEMSQSKGGEFTLPMQSMVAPLISTMYHTKGDFFDLYRFLDGRDNNDLIEAGMQTDNIMHRNYFLRDFKEANKLTKEGLKNRISRLLESQLFQNLTTGASTIKLEELIQQKKVIVFALKKGAMGTDQAAYFGKLIASTIQIIAQQRTELPKEQRVKTHLFIDEFQNYTTKAIKEVLAEARAYGLHLTVAQQIVGQDQDQNFQRTVMGNTYIKVMGTSTVENWSEMAKQTGLPLEMLRKLPRYNYYVKVGNGEPFMTELPKDSIDNNNSMSWQEWQYVLEEQKSLYYTNSPDTVKSRALQRDESKREAKQPKDYRKRNEGAEPMNEPDLEFPL